MSLHKLYLDVTIANILLYSKSLYDLLGEIFIFHIPLFDGLNVDFCQ